MKNHKLKLVLSTLLLAVFMFMSCERVINKTEDKRIYENNQPAKVKEIPKLKTCYKCKGDGIIICNMCGGRGMDNLGMTCSCVRQVESMRALGKTPTTTALRWKCNVCKGTGSLKQRR